MRRTGFLLACLCLCLTAAVGCDSTQKRTLRPIEATPPADPPKPFQTKEVVTGSSSIERR